MNKNKMRNENGITLIALIITIIILVILAAVSIRAAYNSGIIDYSINGTKRYQEEEKKEESVLSETEEKLKSLISKIGKSENEEEQKDYEDNWIIAWVFNGEYWSNPYSKEEGLLDGFFEEYDLDENYSIYSLADVDNASLKALLYENEKENPNDETTYTLVISGTGIIQYNPSGGGDERPWNGDYHVIDNSWTGIRNDYLFKQNYGNKTTRLEIRNGITEIGDNAFECADFMYVYIPSSVEVIGSAAFIFTSYLEEVEFDPDFRGVFEQYQGSNSPFYTDAFYQSHWLGVLEDSGRGTIVYDYPVADVVCEINGIQWTFFLWNE